MVEIFLRKSLLLSTLVFRGDYHLDTLLAEGWSQRFIAQALGFSPSTISREIKRAAVPGCWRYFAPFGQRAKRMARRRAGLARRKLSSDTRTPLWRTVIRWLRLRYSPQQIAGRLKLMNADRQVSHETIYCAIYAQPRGTLRTDLIKMLRLSTAGRRTRGRVQRRFTGIQNITPIELRPPEVAARIVPGHWEGDLIKGARNASAVGTIVERTSRYIMLVKLDNSSSGCVLEAFTQRLRRIPSCLRKTMTYDRGTEMAQHEALSTRLNMDIYFCDPYAPWQRGTNENANGLIREYLPKGMDLSDVSQSQLTAIEKSLNSRPRQVLGFRTPAEVFADLKLDSIAGVALQA